MSLTRTVKRAAQGAGNNVRQALRAVLKRLDATATLPPAQATGLAGEQLQCELMQHYGMASAPLAGAELVILPLGGVSAHGVIIASVDGRYRVALQPGEVALHTDEGDVVHMKRGRIVEVVTDTLLVKAGTKVRFETPLVEATGDVSDGVRTMQADREIYDGHDHNGIQPGPGKTAPPNQKQ